MINYWKNLILFGINSALILKKKFDSKPAYNKTFFKNKIKSYDDEVTDFYDKEIPKHTEKKKLLWILLKTQIATLMKNKFSFKMSG